MLTLIYVAGVATILSPAALPVVWHVRNRPSAARQEG